MMLPEYVWMRHRPSSIIVLHGGVARVGRVRGRNSSAAAPDAAAVIVVALATVLHGPTLYVLSISLYSSILLLQTGCFKINLSLCI